MGIIGSAAGSQLQQSQGTDVNKAQQDTNTQATKTANNAKAESAAGIGTTEEDSGVDERDADGRRLWEEPLGKDGQGGQEDQPPEQSPKSKDATGQKGKGLDLSG